MTPPTETIPLCPHMGCAFKCCNFQQMAHIVLYPGEMEEALAQGKSMAHLEILDQNYHGGGVRVSCRAKNTATCDGGYKPLDCVSYPFFPEIPAQPDPAGGEPELTLCKGAGCPIAGHEIPRHEQFIKEKWQKLLREKPAVVTWLRSFSDSAVDEFDPEPYDSKP